MTFKDIHVKTHAKRKEFCFHVGLMWFWNTSIYHFEKS